jgi:DNA-binding transcriptional LysR family regulator
MTDAGRRLLPYARRVSRLLHEVARAASDDETPQGALTIGSLETTAMPRKSPFVISLSYEERSELVRRSRQYTSPYRDVIRAKIVLLASQGLANDIIAARLDTPRQIVSKWRRRCICRCATLTA